MIKRIYEPLPFKGISFDYFDRIIIVDKELLKQSIIDCDDKEEYKIERLIKEADDIDEMKKIVEEALEIRRKDPWVFLE